MSWRDRLRDEVRALRAYEPEGVGEGARLDANESPYAPEGAEREAAMAALADLAWNRYPEPGVPRLRAAVAARLLVDPAWVTVGNGSDELLPILCTVFGKPPPGRARASILIPTPTFSMYRLCAEPLGLEVRELPLGPRFELDAAALGRAVSADPPNLVFLASPNNPTGAWVERAAVLAALAPAESLVVVDEAYGGFSGRTHRDLLREHPNLILLQSLSKVGLAALRLGVLVARPELVRELDKVRLPYNVNAFSARAAEVLLTRFGDELDQRIAWVASERERLFEALCALPGVEVFPSAANFLLLRMARASLVAEALRARGIVVRNLDRPGPLAGCLRVTVGTPQENDLFLLSMQNILAGASPP